MKRARCIFLLLLHISFCNSVLRGQIGPQEIQNLKQISPAKVEKWQKKAAENNSKAEVRVGLLFETGSGVSEDDSKAVDFYGRAATQGDAMGEVHLGAMYESGKGVPQNCEAAINSYRLAAENRKNSLYGRSYGQLYLGRMNAEGRGVSRNYKEAIRWYKSAADGSDKLAEARFALGDIYEHGLGVPQDYEAAFKWYKKAATNPYPAAWQVLLGGASVGLLLPIAAARYTIVSTPDVRARAQNALGMLYQKGLGVRQSYRKALARYDKAMKLGSADAEDNLATMYEKGWGGRQNRDRARALRWSAEERRRLGSGQAWHVSGSSMKLDCTASTTVASNPTTPQDNGATSDMPPPPPPHDCEGLLTYAGDEAELAGLGEKAFARLDYICTIKFLEQAKTVQSRKVWEQDFPYLAAAYLLGNGDRDKFQRTLQEMLVEMRLNNSYLHNNVTIGFTLQNLTDVRQYVDKPAQDYIDKQIVFEAIRIKRNM
jgi:hypothetical protein